MQALNPQHSKAVVLNGRYCIERELGRGGFGVVFLASDLHLHGRPVVIKAPMMTDPNIDRTRRKFKAEIEALARIQHPGVVSVLDTGETPSGRPYFVMEYIQGSGPLANWLSGAGLSFDVAAEILGQIGSALTAVHNHGICHRDLKPQNILISTAGLRPHIKLIDFGLASLGEQTPSQTNSLIAGTPSYMAPEQLFGDVCEQSDIYSLGVIAYELLTGSIPYSALSPAELHQLQKTGRFTKASRLRPGIPEAACLWIEKCLSFRPSDRFQIAHESTQILIRALSTGPTRGRIRLRVKTQNPVAARILRWMAAA